MLQNTFIYFIVLLCPLPTHVSCIKKTANYQIEKQTKQETHTESSESEREKMRWKIYWIRLMCHLQSLTLGKTLFILELNRAQNATWQKCMFYKNKNIFDHKFCCSFCRYFFSYVKIFGCSFRECGGRVDTN